MAVIKRESKADRRRRLIRGPWNTKVRTEKIDRLVIHESTTSSKKSAFNVLKMRRLSVHVCIDADGSIEQWVPDDREAFHAGSWYNKRSIGIEVINPIYESQTPKSYSTLKNIKWVHKKHYSVPPIDQCISIYQTVLEKCAKHNIKFQIPAWNEDKGIFNMSRTGRRSRLPGIHAHTGWAHSDGAFPLLFCFLMSQSEDPDATSCYDKTIELAKTGRKKLTKSMIFG